QSERRYRLLCVVNAEQPARARRRRRCLTRVLNCMRARALCGWRRRLQALAVPIEQDQLAEPDIGDLGLHELAAALVQREPRPDAESARDAVAAPFIRD